MNQNLINELKFYCNSPEHIGAILLTGEWGCGKTYFINNEFSREKDINDKFILLKISLFGLTNVQDVHKSLKLALIEYLTNNKITNTLSNFDKLQKFIKENDFISNKWGKLFSIDIFNLIPISSEINGKKVVLVFDDLERCQMNSNEILGVINDYCENKNFPTIIIANEEKISELVKTEVDENSNEENKLEYQEIKEKIIQKTIFYKPSYETIVKSIIDSFKDNPDDDYKSFLKTCDEDIVQLFSINGLCDIKDKTVEIPHNIRSLKCSLIEFKRVYVLLKNNGINNIKEWLLVFIAYMQLHKANLIKKTERYGSLLSQDILYETYPMLSKNCITRSIIEWIDNGVWNENQINSEIESILGLIERKQKANTPVEILKTYNIDSVDQDVLEDGFEEYINQAYEGQFSLDEYISLIQNSAYSRSCSVKLPFIDWGKVKQGVYNQIELLSKNLPEKQFRYSTISKNNKNDYTKEEWEIFEIIDSFTDSENLSRLQNKTYFIQFMNEYKSETAFRELNKKAYLYFNEEMEKETTKTFKKLNTHNKKWFSTGFISWCKNIFLLNLKSNYFEITIRNFKMLVDDLKEIKEEYQIRTFEVVHIENFIKELEQIILDIEENNDNQKVSD